MELNVKNLHDLDGSESQMGVIYNMKAKFINSNPSNFSAPLKNEKNLQGYISTLV